MWFSKKTFIFKSEGESESENEGESESESKSESESESENESENKSKIKSKSKNKSKNKSKSNWYIISEHKQKVITWTMCITLGHNGLIVHAQQERYWSYMYHISQL